MKTRRLESGFTLIELGIVIAVIAVLATAVLVGRGFIMSARVGKVVEAIDTVVKAANTYAGQTGGVLPASASTDLLGVLQDRNLVPIEQGGTRGAWQPLGAGGGWVISGARHEASGQNWLLQITCPDLQRCQDVFNAKASDPTTITGGSLDINSLSCHTAAPSSGTGLQLCFRL